jgi:hypothetical protein
MISYTEQSKANKERLQNVLTGGDDLGESGNAVTKQPSNPSLGNDPRYVVFDTYGFIESSNLKQKPSLISTFLLANSTPNSPGWNTYTDNDEFSPTVKEELKSSGTPYERVLFHVMMMLVRINNSCLHS